MRKIGSIINPDTTVGTEQLKDFLILMSYERVWGKNEKIYFYKLVNHTCTFDNLFS